MLAKSILLIRAFRIILIFSIAHIYLEHTCIDLSGQNILNLHSVYVQGSHEYNFS
jgi:hypothetical protein